MDAEIVAIGSELTRGAKLDTNSQWLSTALAEAGITVHWQVTVADDLPRIAQAFRTAAGRSDLVIITGGLGPTQDDLTRDGLATAFERPLEFDQSQFDQIRRLFESRGRTMAERNRLQAMFPRGATPIPNPIGTAPGIWLEVSKGDRSESVCRFAALPGVPSEMKRMYAEFVRPRLPQTDQIIRTARINIFGAGESEVEERLGELTARDRSPEVGITAHEGTITLRIVARGTSEEDCARQFDAVRTTTTEKLGDLVFGEEDVELEHIVAEHLAKLGRTLAIAETATAGLVAHRLFLTERVDDLVVRAITLSPNQFATLAEMTGSPQLAENEMKGLAADCALKLRRDARSDFGLAISPFETVRDAQVAAGLAISLADETGVEVVRHVPVGDWSIARSRAAKAALDLLRRSLARHR
ncbi:CinA family nicotinamide mononucleotide deamidase-related protein [Stratiformator vulcanicus]|uniref:CinA-like protein n=1 Tax=Stratiformator vulcanicus TaxID=2527980 RepID=A0A517R5K2_9PLAN|nr:CinA family nicotinamide mononucleotide deamidase-related protein [Stratiformator vulcanicus]QDT39130.1 Putative competence-damage inducible protein [Stratiformator vulcanicus]